MMVSGLFVLVPIRIRVIISNKAAGSPNLQSVTLDFDDYVCPLDIIKLAAFFSHDF